MTTDTFIHFITQSQDRAKHSALSKVGNQKQS